MTSDGSAAIEPAPSGFAARLDAFQQVHTWANFPLAVLYKYFDDSGGYLAALIAYYGFVSLFPLLLLASTILSFVLSGDASLEHHILTSALSQFPVVGSQLDNPKHLGGGVGGLLIGLLGSLYGGLGVAQAIQYAMNTAWMVPRNSRPNPLKLRGRSLLLLTTVGLAVLATTGLSIIGSGNAGGLGTFIRVLTIIGSVLINAVVFTIAFRLATAKPVSVRDVAIGAVAMAVLWQLLQNFGVVYVNHIVKHASDTNSVFAIVLGLIAFLYLSGIVLIFCIEVNVVRVEQLHPRSLLTPFTDNVVLTDGDRKAYAGTAKAQRNKGFQNVSVSFKKAKDSDSDGES